MRLLQSTTILILAILACSATLPGSLADKTTSRDRERERHCSLQTYCQGLVEHQELKIAAIRDRLDTKSVPTTMRTTNDQVDWDDEYRPYAFCLDRFKPSDCLPKEKKSEEVQDNGLALGTYLFSVLTFSIVLYIWLQMRMMGPSLQDQLSQQRWQMNSIQSGVRDIQSVTNDRGVLGRVSDTFWSSLWWLCDHSASTVVPLMATAATQLYIWRAFQRNQTQAQHAQLQAVQDVARDEARQAVQTHVRVAHRQPTATDQFKDKMKQVVVAGAMAGAARILQQGVVLVTDPNTTGFNWRNLLSNAGQRLQQLAAVPAVAAPPSVVTPPSPVAPAAPVVTAPAPVSTAAEVTAPVTAPQPPPVAAPAAALPGPPQVPAPAPPAPEPTQKAPEPQEARAEVRANVPAAPAPM